MKTANEIRQDFLEFFEKKHGHKIVPSASVIPHNDPTLMFTNAGMNQFKDYFLDRVVPTNRRIADSQKIMRVSGKHNDLDEVGRDGTHHTFFEMLGNWSFGDYYKKEAIQMAWDLLTKVWGLPKDKLWVTTFKSDGKDGIPTDDEAIKLWKEVTDVDPSHIIQLGKKENFWMMGDTGPCGPCSEIHFNRTDEKEFKNIYEALDSEKFVEIWNLVFIQFNQTKTGLVELPAKHVDTGMGLERITALIQKVKSNYDSDLFSPIIKKVEELSGIKYDPSEKGTPFRVIADHSRAITFTITDGVVPSNTGRGYVIRKILRRAARFGRELGLNEPFLYKLVATIRSNMGEAYPELKEAEERVTQIIKEEEARFKKTLDQGLVVFDQYAKEMKVSNKKVFSGKDAFTLYDRYGFPYDLTEVMARENGWEVQESEYKEALEVAKKIAQESGNFKVDLSHIGNDDKLWTRVKEGSSQFTGYTSLVEQTNILEYMDAKDGKYLIVIENNPFYINSGGQVGDTGVLEGESCTLNVIDALTVGNKKALIAMIEEGEFNPAESFQAKVNVARRQKIRIHHTATHLLHASLKKVLGNLVDQKGSSVDESRLRFDFSYSKAMTKDEIRRTEDLVNEQIRMNTTVETNLMNLEEAKKTGAMALFSEKYESKVRVVSSGKFTQELCGGTHASRLGDIGYFKIVREESSAAGIRRIEAVAGKSAELEVVEKENILLEAAELVRAGNPQQLLESIRKLQEENKKLSKELKGVKSQGIDGEIDAIATHAEKINDYHFVFGAFSEASTDDIMRALDILKAKFQSSVLLLASCDSEDKVSLVCAITDDLVKKGLKAGEVLQAAASVVSGKGGGRPNLAKGGGVGHAKINEVFVAARKVLK
jgi:alanyl-tRNA synthetase